MKARLLNSETEKTYVLIFDTGDEVMQELEAFAKRNALGGSHFTAIGAFENVTLGYFEWDRKKYKAIPIHEQVEVISLIGDIALAENGEPKIHAQVVLGKSDGTAWGGHLLEAHVRPTLEVTLIESPKHLQRKHDPAAGIALINLDASEGTPA